jgi:uncharacterized protein (DUF1330 family)
MVYIAVEITVNDPVAYEAYKGLAQSSIAKFGGRYLVRGGKTEALEGSWNPQRFVLLEFPTADVARKWYNSPEYTEARTIRQKCATGKMLLIDGPSFDPSKV